MASLVNADDGTGNFGLIYWRPGASVARITWLGGDGAERKRVVTDEASAVDLLFAIGRDRRARVVSCVVT